MKTFALLDFCLPDYFTGYNRPTMAIPVYGKMTNEELSERIGEELNNFFDYLMFSKTEILIIDEFVEELLKTPENVYVEYEQELTEDEEPAYLYFSFIKPVYNNGIMFCN